MKRPLNASKKDKDSQYWFLKILRNIEKTNWSLVIEVDKRITSFKYSETKKIKQVHSVSPNLKHKLVSSESAIRKSTYQNKNLKSNNC